MAKGKIHVADDQTQKALNHFGRHLVCLSGVIQPIGSHGYDTISPTVRFHSTFVISIRGSWWIATSGHALHELKVWLREKRVRITEFRLYDHYGTGPDREHYIPFDYEGAHKVYDFDKTKGIDWGFIEIEPLTKRLLQANEVVAVPRSEWSTQHKMEFDGYFMLGIPADSYNARDPVKTERGFNLTANPVPTAFYVERLPNSEILDRATHRRFVGQAGNSEGSLQGMSGGPIFGLARNGEHRVVAIQSTWDSTTRVIYGFLVRTAAKLAERRIKTSANAG